MADPQEMQSGGSGSGSEDEGTLNVPMIEDLAERGIEALPFDIPDVQTFASGVGDIFRGIAKIVNCFSDKTFDIDG